MPVVERSLLVLFCVFLLAGIIVRLLVWRAGWDKLMKKALRRAASALTVLGVVGLLLYVFSYERIYVLSMRFGYAIWFALFAWYVWRLLLLVRVEIPAVERSHREREEKNKWLPKSNR